MAAPIVYRWDDSGAPVARGERASLCDILYACLVTGYGSKAAAGWTREYVNGTNDKAAFRPGAGTRFYLQVDGAGGATTYTPNIRGFEVMTSEDDGFGSFTTSYVYTTQVSASADTTARPWVLVADDKFFYFFCAYNETSTPVPGGYVSFLLFGDLVKFDQNDAFACALFAHVNTFPGIQAGSTVASEGATSIATPRPISGTATPHPIILGRGGGPGADYGGFGLSGVPYYQGGPILYTRPYLNNKSAWTIRGWLPGFYYPCHDNAFGQLATVTVDAGSMISVRAIIQGAWGNFFVSTSDWWQ